MSWKHLLPFFSLCAGCTLGSAVVPNALKARSWHGVAAIQEVECSGEVLEADADLLSITLYSFHDNRVLTSVNLRKEDCSTADVYSACAVDHVISRNTRVLALMMDLQESETRMLGCNITIFKTHGVSSISSWSLAVQKGAGLSFKPFYGSSSLVELVCSGRSLETTTDVMSIALFTREDNHVISFVNIAKRECSTNGSFAACVIDGANTRGTEAHALVTSQAGKEYGCNVTVVGRDRLVDTITWYLTVRMMRSVACVQSVGPTRNNDLHGTPAASLYAVASISFASLATFMGLGNTSLILVIYPPPP